MKTLRGSVRDSRVSQPLPRGPEPSSRARTRAPGPPADRLRRRLLRLYAELSTHFGPQHWWPGNSPLEVAVGAILTQNTAWSNVERARAQLKARRLLNARRLHALSLAELAWLIRSSGTYRIKARRLKAFMDFLWTRFAGRLARMALAPLAELRGELLAVPGIGRETADAILLYAVGRPVFVVDAYTRRVLGRHRLIGSRAGYEELRALFERHLPGDPALFNEYHALLVAVGKRYCRGQPQCERCPLRFDLRGRPPHPYRTGPPRPPPRSGRQVALRRSELPPSALALP
ncbi:MAG: endonuclease III domain-containing protein [Candidatus Methylomirabilia bacterium]